MLAGVLANASNREPAGGWNEGVGIGSAACVAGLIWEDSDSGPTKLAKTELRLGGRSAVVETLVEESDSLGVSDNKSVEGEGSVVIG